MLKNISVLRCIHNQTNVKKYHWKNFIVNMPLKVGVLTKITSHNVKSSMAAAIFNMDSPEELEKALFRAVKVCILCVIVTIIFKLLINLST